MKDFLKYMFATVAGIFVFMLIMGILAVMSIAGMVASADTTTNVKENTVLVLNLDNSLEERAEGDLLTRLSNSGQGPMGLEQTLNAIKKAKDNDNVKGIYIEGGMFSSDAPASAQALRKALIDFKKSGKWIVAYADQYTQSAYYVASAADKVWMNPQGMLDWHGVASQPYFLKDLLAKFGVKIQLSKVGTYKSAPEMFTADKMSDYNREQITAYVNGIWENMVREVADSRQISKDSLNAYADGLTMLQTGEYLVKNKMLDKLIYTDEVKGEVKKLLKIDEDDDIHQVSVDQMQNVKEKSRDGERIAVYYAYGDIVDNRETGLMTGNGHLIVGKEVAKELEELMNDDDVKAVVLRVNSGGGSAYASEQIWHAVKNLKAKKPVVVSMGGMAASGGYYISCEANWIVAEPTTLTGSIGIFGMFPDMSELLTQKLGVKFDEVKTNKNATFGTPCSRVKEEEMKYLNMYMDRGYKLFRQRVADGRRMNVDAVEAVAQGRVWIGQDALKIKLVDQMGGLNDAVKKAAELAKLSEYYTKSYPAPADFMEQLMKASTEAGDNYLDAQLRATLGEYYEPFMLLKTMNKQNAIQARIPFYLNLK